MSRSTPARERLQRGSASNRGWLIAMGSVVAFMVAVVGWRLYQESGPPEVRFGVPLVTIATAAGQLTVPTGVYPQLESDGGAVVVKSGRLYVFVVRITADNYKVYDTVSRRGRALTYDPKGYFVDRRHPDVYFDRTTGQATGKKVDDGLREYLSLYTGSAVQITL